MRKNPRKQITVQPERLKALLKDLVDIYSPSGKEMEILEYSFSGDNILTLTEDNGESTVLLRQQ